MSATRLYYKSYTGEKHTPECSSNRMKSLSISSRQPVKGRGSSGMSHMLNKTLNQKLRKDQTSKKSSKNSRTRRTARRR